MGDGDERDEGDLRERIGPRTQARHALLLVKHALGGDLAASVVGAHEREQNDLEHHQTGGEAGQLRVSHLDAQRLLHLLHRGGVTVHGNLKDVPCPFEIEDDHEQREAERDGEREPEITGVAEEKLQPTRKQRRELRDAAGHHGLGERFDLGRGADLGNRDGVRLGVLRLMDSPSVTPGSQVGGVEHFVESQAVGDAEITQQLGGGTLKDHVALIDDRDPVELIQFSEVMDDADEALMMRLREITQEREDLVLRLRVEARGHLVADHAGRIKREFQTKGKATELAARKG